MNARFQDDATQYMLVSSLERMRKLQAC